MTSNFLYGLLFLLTAGVYINSLRINWYWRKHYPNMPNFFNQQGIRRYFRWMTTISKEPLVPSEMKQMTWKDPVLRRAEILHRVLIVAIIIVGIIVMIKRPLY